MATIVDIQQINNGQLPKFGKVYVGSAGTNPITSPVTVYSDLDYTQAIITPIILDGNGRPIDPATGEQINLYVNFNYTINWTDERGAKLLAEYVEVDALAGGGDMLASLYDPTSVDGDAFDMDNMAETVTSKVMTGAERTAISTNTLDIATNTAAIAGISNPPVTQIDDTDSPYTATWEEELEVDCTNGAVIITLATAVGNNGKKTSVTRSDSSSNTLTIDGDGSETINTEANVQILYQYTSLTFISNNTNVGIR